MGLPTRFRLPRDAEPVLRRELAVRVLADQPARRIHRSGRQPDVSGRIAGRLPRGRGTRPVTPTGGPSTSRLVPNDLPLVEPLRLPSRIINLLTGWDLPTPIADAFEPAAKILANIGYTDVVTPTDLANNPALVAAGYQPYDRTFSPAELSIPTPLYSRLPLTFDEYLRVPGDVLTALIVGIVDSIRNVLDPATWQEAFNREPEEEPR